MRRLAFLPLIACAAAQQNLTALPCSCVSLAWKYQAGAVNERLPLPSSRPDASCTETAREWCDALGNAHACALARWTLTFDQFAQVVGATAAACGEDWITEERVRIARTSSAPVWDWSMYTAAVEVLLRHEDFVLPAGSHRRFLEHEIDGAAWMSMGVDRMTELGFASYGGALRHARLFRQLVEQTYRGPPVGSDGSPATVALHVSLERLIDVVAPRHFEVEMYLSIAWRDPRISRSCSGVGEGEVDPGDVCTVFWKPQLMFPGSLRGEDGPQFVEEFGTAFYVGADSPRADSPDAVPGLARSFGHTTYRLRAKFLTVMNYERYPNDEHRFNFTVRAQTTHFADTVVLHSTSSLSVGPEAKHPVWDVLELTSVDGTRPLLPQFHLDALAQAEEQAAGLDPSLPLLKAAFDDSAPLEQRLAFSTFTLRVERYCGYYFGNYVLLETLLVALGFVTFFISPEAMESRLSIALTLVLAINVFQVVLMENLPETGYLTDLSVFTICNTVLLSLIAIETVVVFEAHKHVSQHDAVVSACKGIVRKQSSVDAAIKIQSAARAYHSRNLLRELRERREMESQLRRGCCTPTVCLGQCKCCSRAERHAKVAPQPRAGRSVRRGSVMRSVRRRRPWLARQQKKVKMWWARHYAKHARKISTESDWVCGLILFPSIFITYFCVIYLRDGGVMRCTL